MRKDSKENTQLENELCIFFAVFPHYRFYHKVFSPIKVHQNTRNSVTYKVI